MESRGATFDWNRLRAFLAVAEEGSYTAAARALGLAQPTLGRQVAALEKELGVTLFERVGRGLMATESGLELMEHARAMGEAANRLSLAASGRSQSLEGVVRITATEVASAFVLPPILREMRAAEPGIEVEIVATNSLRDLRRREADIALRAARPADPELIARRLPDGSARLYAAKSLAAADGPWPDGAALARAPFIGFDENEPYIAALNSIGLPVTARNFAIRTASHLVLWELTRAGAGIGVMAEEVGAAESAVVDVAPWAPAFPFELWLVAHRELNASRRVRFVYDWLAKALGRTQGEGR